MSANRSNLGSLVAGAVLIGIGLISLAGQFLRGSGFWGMIWPFFVIGLGAVFFVGMFGAGKSAAGLAIPGTIITVVGLMLFLQNLSGHWESWSYGWTVIIMAVGLGIYIMGWYGENPSQRQSGLGLIKLGAILFIIFGAFFEMIFNSFSFSKYVFPAALILIGAYLIIVRSSLRLGQKKPAGEQDDLPVSHDGS